MELASLIVNGIFVLGSFINIVTPRPAPPPPPSSTACVFGADEHGACRSIPPEVAKELSQVVVHQPQQDSERDEATR